jgi:ABC-2 type transport system permease protein
MNARRVWAVARKEFLHVVRDPRSLLMAIAIPILMLLLFGYALTLDVDHVPMLVWDQSGTARSRELISRFAGSPYFTLRLGVDNERDLVRAIDAGDALVALVVPHDFAERIDGNREAPVQFIVDGSDSNTATIAIGYADVITQIYALELASRRAQRGGGPAIQIPLDVRPRVWFNEELQSKNFIVPGLIAVIMMVISALLTSLTISREWERGTMEQLISTPIKGPELILGKLVPYFSVGMLDMLLAVVMGQFLFHIPLRGDVALMFGLAMIFLAGALSMGMTISIVTKSQLLSSQVAMLATFLPSFLLSGFMFTIANMPRVIQLVTYVVPARYFIVILKGIYLKGVGLEILALPTGLLLVYGAVMALLANFKFRKKLV